jgi:hypothetical protein
MCESDENLSEIIVGRIYGYVSRMRVRLRHQMFLDSINSGETGLPDRISYRRAKQLGQRISLSSLLAAVLDRAVMRF